MINISSREIKNMLITHDALLKSSLAIMREHLACFQKIQALLGVFSPDGILLHAIDNHALFSHSNIGVGSNFSKQSLGSNAVSLCMEKSDFCQVVGKEHSCAKLQSFASCASPLWGGKYQLMGILAVFYPLECFTIESASHLQAIAASINHLHHVHDLLHDQSSILELLNNGVVIFNKAGDIKAVNKKARALLNIQDESMVAVGNIVNFVRDGEPFVSLINKENKVESTEISCYVKNKLKSFVISASFIPEDKGMVCTIIDAKQAHKNAVKTVGFKASYTFDDIVGKSEAVRNVIALSKVTAKSSMTTLLLGESGTGKELFAHAIHNDSAQKTGPFVVVNCGAIPRDLIQSELFGYEGGAFTGATTKGKPGKFELADGGTIFLDEIGEMPMESQVSLLRFLQSKEVIRIGGTNIKHVNVRIVSATNRNLEEAVRNGSFRSDLFYRLCVFTINIPNLRNRGDDLPLLIEYFLHKYLAKLNRSSLKISPNSMQALLNYPWPGNIRELENATEYIVNTTHDSIVQLENLPSFIKEHNAHSLEALAPIENIPQATPPLVTHQDTSLIAKERQAILDALAYYNGNIRLCAQALGIARSALYNKMTKFSIDYARFRKRI